MEPVHGVAFLILYSYRHNRTIEILKRMQRGFHLWNTRNMNMLEREFPRIVYSDSLTCEPLEEEEE